MRPYRQLDAGVRYCGTQCNKLASPQTAGTGIYLEREKVETGTLLLWKSLETIVV